MPNSNDARSKSNPRPFNEYLETTVASAPRSPYVIAASAVFILLFSLDSYGAIKIDGWGIILLLVGVFPWFWQQIIQGLKNAADAFSKTNIDSFEFGNFKIKQLEKRVNIQDDLINQQRDMIDDLVLYSMSYYLYEKLRRFYLGESPEFSDKYGICTYERTSWFDRELLYLMDHGYISEVFPDKFLDGQNLVGVINVTDMGKRFVDMKESRAVSR